MSLAAREKQCSARSSPAETRARRLRSKTRLTGGWRKPLGEVGGRSRGGFPNAAGGRGRARSGTGREAGGAAAREEARAPGPAPAGPILAKVKSEAGASRHRGDSASVCFAPALRNARAGEPEAVTKEPERPFSWRRAPPPPLRRPRDEGEGGGRRTPPAEPAPASGSQSPRPGAVRGVGPLYCGGGSFSASEARSPFFHPPGSLGSGADFTPVLRLRDPRGTPGTRTSGCMGGGVHLGDLDQGYAADPAPLNWDLRAATGKSQPGTQSPQVTQTRANCGLMVAPRKATPGRCPGASG